MNIKKNFTIMAVVILTSDQRINLKNNARYQNLVRQAVENQASYWNGNDGTSYTSASDRARWAKSKFIATGIILNPNAQDYAAWLTRFTIILKNVPVFDNANAYNEDTVLDYMIANAKFDELADLSFNVEIIKIPFGSI